MGLRRWSVVVLGALAFAQVVAIGQAVPGGAVTAPQLSRYPYLTDLVGTSVTVNWATDRSSATGSAAWGAVGAGGVCSPTNSVTATKTAITVNGLAEWQWKAKLVLPAPGSYCYGVLLAGGNLLGDDPSPTFQTQVPAGDTTPYSFAVFGDWGQTDANGNNPDQANLMARIAGSGVRFAVTVGDNGYPNGDQTNYGDLQQSGANISAIFGPSMWAIPGRSIPIFPAAGNHGLSGGTSHTDLTNWPQDVAVSSSGGRYQGDAYCCVNGTTSANYASSWYAFDAGNARFYMLTAAWGDSNVGTADVYANDKAAHWTPGAAEYDWLVSDLAAHPAGAKFAFFHYPLYSDQASQASDPYLQGANSLEGLLARNGVDIVFNGHAHIYQRNRASQAGYPVSYVTGGGGATLQSVRNCSAIDAYAIGWSPSSCGGAPVPDSPTRVYHFLKVTVNGPNVTVAPTDELGRTFDVQTYNFPDTPPDTVIDTMPPVSTNAKTATFTFHATQPNASFSCRLDTNPATACTSPVNYNQLSNGTHQFAVTATTTHGTDPTPPTYVWTVGGPAPSSAGLVVDGFGGLHGVTVGSAAPLTPHDAPYWPGWNIARGVALMPDHSGGYVLDGFGGLHPFAIGSGTAPPPVQGGAYWNGWDIAKGVAITSDGSGGYVVDAWGGLHPFAIGSGTAPTPPADAAYWPRWNIARGVSLLPTGGGYTVDAWGGLHPFSVGGQTPPVPSGGPYWAGWDIVRGVTLLPDGSAGYVLDGFGGVHGFRVTGAASAATLTAYWDGWDIARGVDL